MIKGKAHKYGDDINTDLIIPARYLNLTDPRALAKHCMEDLDTNFINKISMGDILVAGRNFGCGSSREHAPLAIKESGIACVIASSFARIFFRNAINIGLPIVESAKASARIREGDAVEVDLKKGLIKNITRKENYHIVPFPPFLQELIQAGGLVEWARNK